MEENEVGRILVVGGSAGSLDSIMGIISRLTEEFDGACIVVLHRMNHPFSKLEKLLARKTKIPVREVEDKDPIEPRHIYIAPPDYHLLLEDKKTFSLDSSEKIHFSRPSIDATFESAAMVFGSSCVGCLLSGANADGAEGLKAIKMAGGVTVVEDPTTAEMNVMPLHAIQLESPTLIAGLADLPDVIARLMTDK